MNGFLALTSTRFMKPAEALCEKIFCLTVTYIITFVFFSPGSTIYEDLVVFCNCCLERKTNNVIFTDPFIVISLFSLLLAAA